MSGIPLNPVLFCRWKSWGRLGWDQRDKSCWIWRYFWTLSHNSWRLPLNCLTLRWKERRQQTAWSWGILDWNRTSSSWWWAGNRKSSIKIFSLPFLHEAWKRRLLKHRQSLRICRKSSTILRKKKRSWNNSPKSKRIGVQLSTEKWEYGYILGCNTRQRAESWENWKKSERVWGGTSTSWREYFKIIFKVKEVNPKREGKKLLVLDIDYTLFDHRQTIFNRF